MGFVPTNEMRLTFSNSVRASADPSCQNPSFTSRLAARTPPKPRLLRSPVRLEHRANGPGADDPDRRERRNSGPLHRARPRCRTITRSSTCRWTTSPAHLAAGRGLRRQDVVPKVDIPNTAVFAWLGAIPMATWLASGPPHRRIVACWGSLPHLFASPNVGTRRRRRIQRGGHRPSAARDDVKVCGACPGVDHHQDTLAPAECGTPRWAARPRLVDAMRTEPGRTNFEACATT